MRSVHHPLHQPKPKEITKPEIIISLPEDYLLRHGQPQQKKVLRGAMLTVCNSTASIKRIAAGLVLPGSLKASAKFILTVAGVPESSIILLPKR
jgi:hypothetical protein